MPMTKAEMEEHRRQYHALMAQANDAEQAGLYALAIERARASWAHIDGMMQYQRRYENTEFESVPAIDLTLKYAPLLLDSSSLDALETLLKDRRRIEKNTSDSMGAKLATARELLWRAHRLWDHLESNLDSRQHDLHRLLGGRQQDWRGIVEEWDRMGLLRREPDGTTYRLTLTTRMGEIVPAKCPACGEKVEVSKALCLKAVPCPRCQRTAVFVILSPASKAEAKE